MVASNKQECFSQKNFISKLTASGSTNFVAVFEQIISILDKAPENTELTTIFFTDGEDTCNDDDAIFAKCKQFSETMKARCESSRVMSIGFSNDHDARFMNRLAQAGSDVGNFIFIRSDSETKREGILNALEECLAIAVEGSRSKTGQTLSNPRSTPSAILEKQLKTRLS